MIEFAPKHLDKQESYFPAETLKYLYLLFKPRKDFDLESLEEGAFKLIFGITQTHLSNL